ncbi:hypothetical protein Tco_0464185 [Tanacetum coccineum]
MSVERTRQEGGGEREMREGGDEKAVGTRNWLDMVAFYCREYVDEQREFDIKMGRLRGEMIEACQDKIAFV